LFENARIHSKKDPNASERQKQRTEVRSLSTPGVLKKAKAG